MGTLLKDIVSFRGDLLFNGAVNVDWYISDDRRRQAAAKSFVFHGPEYHGVIQEDLGADNGHRLMDTVSFTPHRPSA